ncbi:hypothetical protein R1sor_024563 [Riccia sorocarpa]|uniref:Protein DETOXIFICATION n=1 Tax=Riccia sorocarpa TaxID=122646 RepID=A0ABD3GTV7_9MARC
MGSDDSGSMKEPLLFSRGKSDGVQHRSSNLEAGEKIIDGYVESIGIPPLLCGPESEIMVEVKRTAKLAWPLMLSNFLILAIPVCTMSFIGHLGELELASASIATSFAMATAFLVMIGLASALETLCGQAYGAKNYRLMGVYLQSSFIISTFAAFIILALWMNMATIFIAMGQVPEVARLAQKYLLWLTPGVFGSGILRPTTKFMQSQGAVIPVLLCTLIATSLHVPACYILIYVLDFGLIGGALATCFTFQSLTVYIVVYGLASGRFKETFQGFTWEAFHYTRDYLKLAIPSTFMMCLEFWTAEVLVLTAGLLPNAQLQLSLLSVSLSSVNLVSMIPTGLGAAAATRVANELGAYRSEPAKLAWKVSLGMSLISTCIVSLCILMARNLWGKIFSDVAEVLDGLRAITPLVALAALLDGFQGVLTGVVRGCGRQSLGTHINLLAFYIFGIPCGLILGFSWHFGARGLWMGLIVGEALQCLLLGVLILITNWDKMADDAVRRVGLRTGLLDHSKN